MSAVADADRDAMADEVKSPTAVVYVVFALIGFAMGFVAGLGYQLLF